jgi:hypothetical protein
MARFTRHLGLLIALLLVGLISCLPEDGGTPAGAVGGGAPAIHSLTGSAEQYDAALPEGLVIYGRNLQA